VLCRLESHYTPKHASWLNMVEIEIGVLGGQCLDRPLAIARSWSHRLPPGNGSAIAQGLVSNGCSPPSAPAASSRMPIATQPKSRNLCAKVLAAASRLASTPVVGSARPAAYRSPFWADCVTSQIIDEPSPPSRVYPHPVHQLDRSEARNTTSLAISSGSALRLWTRRRTPSSAYWHRSRPTPW
jgi:hypothetical protein